jgi:hypothetical protein
MSSSKVGLGICILVPENEDMFSNIQSGQFDSYLRKYMIWPSCFILVAETQVMIAIQWTHKRVIHNG